MLWQVGRLNDKSVANVGPMVFAVVVSTISGKFIAKRQRFSQDLKHLDLQKVFQEDLDSFVQRQQRLARTGKLDVKQLVKDCFCILDPKHLTDKRRGL